jgi:hypothetical protein
MTTPRPWEATPNGWCVVGANGETVAYIASEGCDRENAPLIERAVNAFDALLAVAKGVAEPIVIGDDELVCRCCDGRLPKHDLRGCVLKDLDAAHPDWRTW